jgi:hypothetical protein
VNGSLSQEDRQWDDDRLRESPQARALLEWERSLRDGIGADAPQVPDSIGLARTLQRIESEAAAKPTNRLMSWLGRLGIVVPPDSSARGGGGFAMRPAFALALVGVVVLQFGVIGAGVLRSDADVTEIRSDRVVPVADGPLLKLSFTPSATEADLRFALLAVRGSLVGGPGQLGDYYIRVPKGTEVAAQAALQTQSGVASVETVPGLPARP